MAKGKKVVEIPPERVAEIQEAARSGTNWAELVNYGPACTCGLKTAKDPCPRHVPVQ